MQFAYVVLAAGSSMRMGRDKLTVPLAGRSPLERLAMLLDGRALTVVTSAERFETCKQLMPNAIVLINERPQDGMTSSLRVALASIASYEFAAILLGDKPLLALATIDRLESVVTSSPHDVVYPQSQAGVPGHPVYVSRRAREEAERLPAGDTLRALRHDPSITSLAVPCDDTGAFLDIDTEEDWSRAERFARASGR